jgi:hypothetical protein
MLEMQLSLDNSATNMGMAVSNIKEMPSRLMGNRWAFTVGAEMKDLKEKIEMVPYYTVTIKTILMLVCPFFMFTVIFATFRWVALWIGSWLAVSFFPVVVNAMRAVHNSTMMSKLGLQDLVAANSSAKHLTDIVNVDLVKSVIDDYIPLAYSMLTLEMTIISILSGLIMYGSWMAGMAGNGFVGWLGSSISGHGLNTGLRSGTDAAHRSVDQISASTVRTLSRIGSMSLDGGAHLVNKTKSLGPNLPAIFPKGKDI